VGATVSGVGRPSPSPQGSGATGAESGPAADVAPDLAPGALAPGESSCPATEEDPSSSARVGGPVPSTSRVGRERQRYSPRGERLVAGCLAVRAVRPSPESGSGSVSGSAREALTPGPAVDPPDAWEVLIISSRGGKG